MPAVASPLVHTFLSAVSKHGIQEITFVAPSPPDVDTA
jgi:hypothetical protein